MSVAILTRVVGIIQQNTYLRSTFYFLWKCAPFGYFFIFIVTHNYSVLCSRRSTQMNLDLELSKKFKKNYAMLHENHLFHSIQIQIYILFLIRARRVQIYSFDGICSFKHMFNLAAGFATTVQDNSHRCPYLLRYVICGAFLFVWLLFLCFPAQH